MTKKCVALLEDVVVIEIEVVFIGTVALKEIEIDMGMKYKDSTHTLLFLVMYHYIS